MNSHERVNLPLLFSTYAKLGAKQSVVFSYILLNKDEENKMFSTSTKLSEETGVHRHTVETALAKLAELGIIIRNKREIAVSEVLCMPKAQEV